jgi:hypothetical protein
MRSILLCITKYITDVVRPWVRDSLGVGNALGLRHTGEVMKKLLRRIRGALGMGLVWAAGWAVVGGGIMEAFVDPHGAILDMWPQTLAIVGFVGGVVFSTLLGIAERRRRFGELSIPRFTAWGAVAGLLLGILVGTPKAELPQWLLRIVIIGPTTLLSAASAAASLALARRAEKRDLLDAGADVAEVGRTEGQAS